MQKLFGLCLVILCIGVAAGCIPVTVTDEPSQEEPIATALSPVVNTIVPSFTPDTVITVTNPPPPTITPIPETPQPTHDPPASILEDTIIVIVGDSEVYPIKVGQVFTLQGSRGPGWQIGYDQSFLTLLTPVEMHEQPGDYWEFQANQVTGLTRIWLTNASMAAGAEIQMEAFIEIVNE